MPARIVSLAFVLLGLGACGRIAPGTEIDGDASAAVDAGAPLVDGPDPVASPRPPTRSGLVDLGSVGDDLEASATFTRSAGMEAHVARQEGCAIVERGAAARPGATAGTITVSLAAKSGNASLELAYLPGRGVYDGASLRSPTGTRFETAGTAITVRAEGGVVPAFEASVTSAYETTIVAPVEGALLGRSDLEVRWSDTGNDRVAVRLSNSARTAVCTFAASARRGTLPASVVSPILDGPFGVELCSGGPCVDLQVEAARTAYVTAGDWEIELRHFTRQGRHLRAPP